uniref:Uncharacterized protein n=1 Tax=Arion vulgaris TaxID=1028688 RepID=A0A0B7ADY2_9EUPU
MSRLCNRQAQTISYILNPSSLWPSSSHFVRLKHFYIQTVSITLIDHTNFTGTRLLAIKLLVKQYNSNEDIDKGHHLPPQITSIVQFEIRHMLSINNILI